MTRRTSPEAQRHDDARRHIEKRDRDRPDTRNAWLRRLRAEVAAHWRVEG